ncbi:hypothetical protein K435DRAFT_772648 [Dendrothele bispora CBS 962.96]|uniref:Uncharacterized protein n=1 Tax=Dendrothele bispora (strain CBS 962.96) TaxID=1314807 RepID=A0A4S8MW07_DENBC|nr:hypothetical protein K435DRAFT_772648 [Dendrothele bispora CBS 962.96]
MRQALKNVNATPNQEEPLNKEAMKKFKQTIKNGNGTQKKRAHEAGEDQERARKRKKISFGGISAIPAPKSDSPEAIADFQTASHLLEALKSLKLNSPVTSGPRERFHGSHSIVADPTVRNKKRAKWVARDASKLGGLPFDYKSTLHPPVHSRKSYKLTFRCTCAREAIQKETIKKPIDPSVSSNVSLKGVGQEADNPNMSCRGVIEVTAEDDNTRPYVKGQKISIRICH